MLFKELFLPLICLGKCKRLQRVQPFESLDVAILFYNYFIKLGNLTAFYGDITYITLT